MMNRPENPYTKRRNLSGTYRGLEMGWQEGFSACEEALKKQRIRARVDVDVLGPLLSREKRDSWDALREFDGKDGHLCFIPEEQP
jgi:hypothetical protein